MASIRLLILEWTCDTAGLSIHENDQVAYHLRAPLEARPICLSLQPCPASLSWQRGFTGKFSLISVVSYRRFWGRSIPELSNTIVFVNTGPFAGGLCGCLVWCTLQLSRVTLLD